MNHGICYKGCNKKEEKQGYISLFGKIIKCH